MWLLSPALFFLSLPGEHRGGPRELRATEAGQGQKASVPGTRGGVVSGEMRGGFIHSLSKSVWGGVRGVLPGTRHASGSEDVKGREAGLVVKKRTPDSSVGEAYRLTPPVEGCDRAPAEVRSEGGAALAGTAR